MTSATEPSLHLRPYTADDVPLRATLARPDVAAPWDTFDPGEPMIDGRLWGGDQAVVDQAGEGRAAVAVASVSWMQVPYGPNRRSLAWRIGIVVLPEHRNRGIGAAAQRLLADHLFATSPANRIEAHTDVGNITEQRALIKAGFALEGVLRGAQWRQGAWHDGRLYSRLRDDG